MGCVLLGASAWGPRAPVAAATGAALGVLAARASAARGGRARTREVARAVPVAADRMVTCVMAGMSVERALRTVAPKTPGALGEALDEGLRALDLGVARSRAYDLVAERADCDEVRKLTRTLARAERYGTSVASALRALARELRDRERAAAEAEARTAPVKLVFPLVFCFLPAFVLLTIGPVVVSAVRALGGI